ncbi:Crp/Fnr family transcriptional regulator [Marinospirillum perlucidum]|uniref:Crp/Fnr family transcriptional regulator n=1 Tax=Marinospirillum perlucidum TaxID=1982602 RepID=UPI000DF25D84|nr:Crp/Fnr family transcriptional regulator [Marinospirillum perlucidum]
MSEQPADSCIIKHFQSYTNIDDKDQQLLLSLEKGPQEWSKNAILWQQGDKSDSFFTLNKGWACSFRDMEDGSRQVLDVFVPGDIIGLREFAFQTRITSVVLLTDAVLCSFPRQHLDSIFASSLTLCNLMFMIIARDQAILLERLVNLGRRTAREKLAHFLVELAHRLGRTNALVEKHLSLPLTQNILADALGLTSVHINRTLQDFRQEGLLNTGNCHLELLNIKGLAEVAGFDAFYLETSVFSQPAKSGCSMQEELS